MVSMYNECQRNFSNLLFESFGLNILISIKTLFSQLYPLSRECMASGTPLCNLRVKIKYQVIKYQEGEEEEAEAVSC